MKRRTQIIQQSAAVLQSLQGSTYSLLFAAISLYDAVAYRLLEQPRLVSSGWTDEELGGVCLIVATRFAEGDKVNPDEISKKYFKGSLRIKDLAKMTKELIKACEEGLKYPTAYEQAKEKIRSIWNDGGISEDEYIKVCQKMASLMLNFLTRPPTKQSSPILMFLLLQCGIRVLKREQPNEIPQLLQYFPTEINSISFEMARLLMKTVDWEYKLTI